jgi:hypothetical protein
MNNERITLEDIKRMQKAMDEANVPMPICFFSNEGKRYKHKRIPVYPFEVYEEVPYNEGL